MLFRSSPIMSWQNAHNSIEIVATEDNTIVTITPTQTLSSGQVAGVPYNIILMRGQTYSFAVQKEWDHSLPAAKHLRNTRITSNKPIAVNTTDDSVAYDSTGNGGYDLIGEQIVPISLTGTKYIAIRNTDRIYNGNVSGQKKEYVDHVYFFPTQNNTNVTIYPSGQQGDAFTIPLQMGGEYSYPLSQEATYIESDKPIVVFQMISSDDSYKFELGGTQLPQIECTGVNKVQFSAVNTNSPIVNILVKTADIHSFSVTGLVASSTITASDFNPVPGNPSWSYCRKSVTMSNYSNGWNNTVTVPVVIENSTGYFHLAVADQNTSTCSYAYYSNYNTAAQMSLMRNKDNYCLGDSMVLSSTNILAVDTLIWILPSGQEIRRHKNEPYIIPELTMEHIGHYTLDGINRFGCGVLSDGFDLMLTPPVFREIFDTICDTDLPYRSGDFETTEGGDYVLNLFNKMG